MKVADIYYMQMEKPDRDPKNAEQAEQEYRTMIQQFPDSTFVPRAKQRLREVQEVLAERQYQIGSFLCRARKLGGHHRPPADRHRHLPALQPQRPGADRAGRRVCRRSALRPGPGQQINPKAKQELMKAYDDQAADAYARVVTHYSMAPHVEDARERLIALNRTGARATKEELAESEAEEQSRTGITFKDRALSAGEARPSHGERCPCRRTDTDRPPQVTAPDVHKRDTGAVHRGAQRQAAAGSALRLAPAPAAVAQRSCCSARAGRRLHRCNWRMCPARITAHPRAADPRSEPALSARARAARRAAPAQIQPAQPRHRRR